MHRQRRREEKRGTCREEKLGLIFSLTTVILLRDCQTQIMSCSCNWQLCYTTTKLCCWERMWASVLKWDLCLSNWASMQPVMNVSPPSCVHIVSPLTLIWLCEWHSRLLSILGSVTINAWPLTYSVFCPLLSSYLIICRRKTEFSSMAISLMPL